MSAKSSGALHYGNLHESILSIPDTPIYTRIIPFLTNLEFLVCGAVIMSDFDAFYSLYHSLCQKQLQGNEATEDKSISVSNTLYRPKWGSHQILSGPQMKELFSVTKFESARQIVQVCSIMRKLDLCYLEGKLWGFQHPDEKSQLVLEKHLRSAVLASLRQGC